MNFGRSIAVTYRRVVGPEQGFRTVESQLEVAILGLLPDTSHGLGRLNSKCMLHLCKK